MRWFKNAIDKFKSQKASSSASTPQESSSSMSGLPANQWQEWAPLSSEYSWTSITFTPAGQAIVEHGVNSNQEVLNQMQDVGAQHAGSHVAVYEAAHGKEQALHYALGLACGARDYILKELGARAAYNTFAQMADDAMDTELPKDPA